MKRLLLLITICISSVSFGQYTSIPDPNFEQALIDLGHDDVIDGQVLTSNISGVTNLNVDNLYNISDLTGISDFSSLNFLNCGGNQLTSLNVSQNTGLIELYCTNNQLTNLTLNDSLLTLVCFNNQLTELNISNCFLLSGLTCSRNQINNIDLSQNNNLEVLDISSNPVSNLVLNNLSNLKDLWIEYTDISSIDLASNIYLEILSFGFLREDDITEDLTWSPMTSIDLSSNIFLKDVSYFGGALESLDLSNCIGNGYSDISIDFPINMSCLNLANGTNGIMPNGGDIISLDINDKDEWGIPCPSLCIEVDDINIANSVWNNNIDHSNYTFSTDCGDCTPTSNLTELNSNKPKKLIKIVNLLGQEVEYTPNTVLIYQYSDGTSEKVFTIED